MEYLQHAHKAAGKADLASRPSYGLGENGLQRACKDFAQYIKCSGIDMHKSSCEVWLLLGMFAFTPCAQLAYT